MNDSANPIVIETDLVIIGAGIHGAAVAREAAARSWSVIVMEQYAECALGTSSKSSKLIHGGLRYLESMEIALVHECLQEQRILLKTAPHLVHSNQFYIPITAQMKRPAWMIQIGLWVYFLLGGKRPRKQLADALAQDGLQVDRIKNVLVYHDAQTDDKSLTQDTLHSATMMGARTMYSTTPEKIAIASDHVTVSLTEHRKIHAKAVVNVSGPWINDVLARVYPAQPRARIDLIKGSHIVLPDAPTQGCYYLEAEDNRVIFVMPWRGKRLVGTTEVECSADTRHATASEEEIAYLLRTHNRYFSQQYDRTAVIDAWAGIRVLPKGNDHAFKRPREAIFLRDHPNTPRLISLVGGKLTSHRATASTICALLARVMPNPHYKADTASQALPSIQNH